MVEDFPQMGKAVGSIPAAISQKCLDMYMSDQSGSKGIVKHFPKPCVSRRMIKYERPRLCLAYIQGFFVPYLREISLFIQNNCDTVILCLKHPGVESVAP